VTIYNELFIGRLVDYRVAETDKAILTASIRTTVGDVVPATVGEVLGPDRVSLYVHADGLVDGAFVENVTHGYQPGDWHWRGPTAFAQAAAGGISVGRAR
jgi:hypothetical protein